MTGWDPAVPGLLRLPSGRAVRGRALRTHPPAAAEPQFGAYLLGRQPPATSWPQRWVRWRDWWLPADTDELRAVLREVRERARTERVEVACAGGLGRTGTALACLAILDGVDPQDAVRYVRMHYHPRAVETPWQRGFVRRFDA